MSSCDVEPGASLAQGHLSADLAQIASAAAGHCDGESTDVVPDHGHAPGPTGREPHLDGG